MKELLNGAENCCCPKPADDTRRGGSGFCLAVQREQFIYVLSLQRSGIGQISSIVRFLTALLGPKLHLSASTIFLLVFFGGVQ